MRLLVSQLHVVAEEAFWELDRLTAAYEEAVCRLTGREIHTPDVQQLLEIKADVPPECLDLDQEDPEPLHIKEEEEDLWTHLEGEQLNVLEEADITKFTFTAVTVKSEDDKPQTSQLHQSQTEDNREAEPPASRSATPIKAETDGEDCGASGPARNLNPHRHSHPNADDVALKRHKRVHTGEKPFSCDVCGKSWVQQGELNKHKRIHTGEKPFRCDVCGKSWVQQGDLNKHKRVHTGEKPFSCDVCGKRFTVQGSLKIHMRVHTGEKPFNCDVCGIRLSHQGSLKTHMRLHTGEKPFNCDVCGERFTQQGSLKAHMRIHTGEKPFNCDVCGKRVSHQGSLRTHMRVHTGEKPFNCDVCGKRFSHQGSLKKHISVHTG